MKRIIFLFGLVILTSCTYHEISLCDTDEPTYSDCVKPIFEEHCMGCHYSNNPEEIMVFSNFQVIQDKVINGTIIESLEREIGFMPKNGERLSSDKILIIKKWKENGAQNN